LIHGYAIQSEKKEIAGSRKKHLPRVLISYEQCLDVELAVKDVGCGVKG